MKTQRDHRIIVNTVDKYLSIKSKENKLVPLVPIEDIFIFHSQALLCYLYDDNFSISANTIFTTIKGDKRTIIELVLEGMDIQEDLIKSVLRNLLITFNDIVAISSIPWLQFSFLRFSISCC